MIFECDFAILYNAGITEIVLSEYSLFAVLDFEDMMVISYEFVK